MTQKKRTSDQFMQQIVSTINDKNQEIARLERKLLTLTLKEFKTASLLESGETT